MSTPPPAPWRGPGLRGLLAAALLATWAAPAPAQQAPGFEPEQRHPRLTCYRDYLQLEALHGLEGIRAAVRQAIERRDMAALQFLGERLAEVIGSDANAALQVIEWAQGADEPELPLYLNAVRDSQAVQTPQVVNRLLDMAERHQDPRHQAAALVSLESQRRLEPQVMERLTTLAKQDKLETGVAMHAARAIGRVMENDFRRSGQFEPYMHKLLEVALDSHEPDVRSLAMEMGVYPAARLDKQSVEQLARLHATDPSPEVREMAALVMSSGRDTEAVLGHFRQSFPAEKELCVRWAILRFALRAGGPSALPLVQEFARKDPRFQQDYLDFKSLYDAGHVDFDRVWLNKPIRHQCEASDG